MTHGGQQGWEVVSGSRRNGGMFRDEVARTRRRELVDRAARYRFN